MDHVDTLDLELDGLKEILNGNLNFDNNLLTGVS